VTLRQLMAWMVPVALGLWLVRPALTILLLEGVGSHSHPTPIPARAVTPQGAYTCLIGRGRVVHGDPFWPHYWRSLAGRPWPGDYTCPLVPSGTEVERPANPHETISADMF
jgi:hypothetical protein